MPGQFGHYRPAGLLHRNNPGRHIPQPRRAEFQMAPYLGDRAAEFIAAQAHQDNPFLMYVSCLEPHSPYIGPLQDKYDPMSLPVGPTFLKKPENASLLHRAKSDYYLQYMCGGDPVRDEYMTTWTAVGEDITTELGWRTLRAHYFANISLVDTMVGKITAALDRAGLTDNTIIVFTSDHGDLLGDHGMLEKRSFYEESARVPLLLAIPGLNRPSGKSAAVSAKSTCSRPCWTCWARPSLTTCTAKAAGEP